VLKNTQIANNSPGLGRFSKGSMGAQLGSGRVFGPEMGHGHAQKGIIIGSIGLDPIWTNQQKLRSNLDKEWISLLHITPDCEAMVKFS
jgi:hypothetical protein